MIKQEIDWSAEFYAVTKHLEEHMLLGRGVDRAEFFSAMITYAQGELMNTYRDIKNNGRTNCEECHKLIRYTNTLTNLKSQVNDILNDM